LVAVKVRAVGRGGGSDLLILLDFLVDVEVAVEVGLQCFVPDKSEATYSALVLDALVDFVDSHGVEFLEGVFELL
jgi:hypothetical protein